MVGRTWSEQMLSVSRTNSISIFFEPFFRAILTRKSVVGLGHALGNTNSERRNLCQ